jgi:hypothetical protein
MSLSRLYLRTRLDIFNVFLKYRRYTLVRSFVLPPFSPHFRRQFSTFLSRRLHQCTLVLRFLPTFNTSRFPLGAPSSYSPFSTSSLMSLRRLLRRRMRDRSRHFVYFKFVFSPSRRFGRLLSAIVQHVRRTCVLNAVLFCSRLRLLLFHLLPVYSHSLLFRRRLDVHLR